MPRSNSEPWPDGAAWRWPNGFECPERGSAKHCVIKPSPSYPRGFHQCNACERRTSPVAGHAAARFAVDDSRDVRREHPSPAYSAASEGGRPAALASASAAFNASRLGIEATL